MATIQKTSGLAKAYKVLKITAPEPEKSGLMTIPRELRDQIWSDVFYEPSLLFRRHKPECKFYDPVAASVSMPALLVHQMQSDRRGPTKECPEQSCKERCIKRKSLSLLRVSKQVSHEAMKVFYRETTFSFLSYDQFMDTIKNMSQVIRSRIQKLAIQEAQHRDLSSSLRQTLFATMSTFANLRSLELPPQYVGTRPVKMGFDISSIDTLVLSRLRQINYTTEGEELAPWAYVAKTLKIPHSPRCGCENSDQGSRCIECRSNDLTWFLKELDTQKFADDDTMDLVKAEMDWRRPPHPTNQAYSFRTKLEDGKKQTICILGLATESRKTRNKLRLKVAPGKDMEGQKPELNDMERFERAVREQEVANRELSGKRQKQWARAERAAEKEAQKKALQRGRREAEKKRSAGRKIAQC